MCDGNKLNILLEKADKCPKLKHIIKIGDVSEEDRTKVKEFGITILSFVELEVQYSGIFLSIINCNLVLHEPFLNNHSSNHFDLGNGKEKSKRKVGEFFKCCL